MKTKSRIGWKLGEHMQFFLWFTVVEFLLAVGLIVWGYLQDKLTNENANLWGSTLWGIWWFMFAFCGYADSLLERGRREEDERRKAMDRRDLNR